MGATIFLGGGGSPCQIDLKYANRHGLVAGATGTGKTVTLRALAEGFSAAGVPVFAADIKGDLSGLSRPGEPVDFVLRRAETLGMEDFGFDAFPVVHWDVLGEQGHPVRATISEMGPVLLSRLLGLNDVQEGVLNAAFDLADDEGLLLLDLKDLRAMLSFVADNATNLRDRYGNISAASVGAIQRGLLVLEQQGAERFFGEPALRLDDLMRTEGSKGVINLLAADRLIRTPKLYATFLLWLLSELFEELPEVGDLEKPKLVFFFDEAHLLFDDAPKALLDKVSQVVRLIRSKGVGVYFVTQSPGDLPEEVLAQLGNRVQHALRAYTPRERKALKAAADSFRENPAFDTAQAIGELGVGEALVSTLGAKGVPGVVERALIRPPASRLRPLDAVERQADLARSPVRGLYDAAVDRDSAYEILQRRAAQAEEAERRARAEEERAAETRRQERQAPRRAPAGRGGDSILEATAKSVLRSVGSQLGRQLVRGILGSILRGR